MRVSKGPADWGSGRGLREPEGVRCQGFINSKQ